VIAKLTGEITEHDGEQTIINVGGVGYGVYLSAETQGRSTVGSNATFYIHENIRENGHDLYGFMSLPARKLFELLLSVNGVGPKSALAITNLGSEEALRAAIAAGDVKFLTAASGIGKKAAERIVVDLKNKVGLVSPDTAIDFLHDLPENSQDEAMQALVALGYSPSDAAGALRGVDTELPLEQRVKLALKRKK
jgi:holliday junction DNA helicase RuvA